MHAVVRTYSGQGAKELFDLIEQRKAEVESLIRSVSGFHAYTLFRTDDGGDMAGESVVSQERTLVGSGKQPHFGT